jgi:uncharacterized delta-60 repeat protein
MKKMKKMKKIAFTLFLFSSIVFGQNYSIDNTFNPTDTGVFNQDIGSNGNILDNGKILSLNNGTPFLERKKLFRLNADGSIDNTFPTIISNYYIDGLFANKALGNFIISFINQSTNQINIKSYDANGIISSTFITPTFSYNGSGNRINKIIFLTDGKFLILGSFNFVNGISSQNIVRLNSNGSIDTSFNIGTGFSSQTSAFALQSDGKYLIGGNFTSFNGESKGRLLRLFNDGTLDPTFNVYTNSNVFGLANGFSPILLLSDIIIEPNGKIITAGPSLVASNSNYRNTIVRFNSNGTVDPSFQLNFLTNYCPSKLLYNTDGSIYFNVNQKLRKCDNSGNLITSFNDSNIISTTTPFYDNDISFSNNKIVIVSNYKNNFGITRFGYHRLNLNGSLDLTFNPHFGINSTDHQLINSSSELEVKNYVLPDNKILIYSDYLYNFTTYNDIPVKSIIRLNENGELDTSFNLDSNLNSSYSNFYIPSGISTNKIFDGFIYLKIGTNTIYKLNNNGSINSTIQIPSQTTQFKLNSNNKMIGIGDGAEYKVGNLFKIIRFNNDSTIDNTFNSPNFNNQPVSFEILNDNKILLSFGNPFGYYNIIKLNENGSINNTYGVQNYTFKTKTINDKIYLSTIGYIKKLNSDFSIDNSFTVIPTSNSINYLTLSNDRTLTKSNVTNSGQLTFKINGSNGNEISNFVIQTDKINTYSSQNCENIILSGNFNNILGFTRHNICRLTVPGTIVIPTPVGAINQLFSQGQTLADLVVNGQNIQWYAAQNECAFSGNMNEKSYINDVLPSSTILVNGTTYFASQTMNSVESNHRLPVTVIQPLGNVKFTFGNLKLFPNPIKDVLTISNPNIIDKVEIYNLTGQKIIEKEFSENNIKIDLINFDIGMYFVKSYSQGQTQTNKIVKE